MKEIKEEKEKGNVEKEETYRRRKKDIKKPCYILLKRASDRRKG